MDRLSIIRATGGSISRTIRTSLRQPGDISEHLKGLIKGRDDAKIITFLEESEESSASNEDFKVGKLHTFHLLYHNISYPDCYSSADNYE